MMPGAQRRVKPAWHKKLFSHKQTTSHQRDDVPEFGNHREITEHQSADYVCVGYLATLLGPLRKDFTNWPVEKPALPTVAAVVIGLRPFVNEWLPAQQKVSSPEVRRRQRIAPDIDGVSFQSLLRNNMFRKIPAGESDRTRSTSVGHYLRPQEHRRQDHCASYAKAVP